MRPSLNTLTRSSMKIDLKGHLASNKTRQWLRTEGAADIGEIPNGVISMTNREQMPAELNKYRYQAVLVYSCGENYLFQKVFQSVQVKFLKGFFLKNYYHFNRYSPEIPIQIKALLRNSRKRQKVWALRKAIGGIKGQDLTARLQIPDFQRGS